jgi:excisionase family DNA binding protein
MSQLSTGLGPDEQPTQTQAAPLAVAPLAAARLLSVCVSKIYRLMASGELESFHSGKSRRVTTKSIDHYIERQIAAAKQAHKKGR